MDLSLILLISGIVLGSLSIYLLVRVLLGNNADSSALAWASGDEPARSKSPIINYSRPLVHNFTLQHSKKIKSESFRKSIEEKLTTAGLAGELNVDEFIGLQILWGLLFPVFLVLFNLALELGFPTPMIAGLGLLGFYFPHLYANEEKKKRNQSIQIDLPFFIDLLALSTEAGLDFVGAIQRIVEKANDSVLAQELDTVLQDIRLGASRADALRALSDRVDLSEVISFVAVVVDADQTGASISKVLKDQAEQLRLERFVRAEKAGAKASQAIMLPLVVFIVPAVFIIVLAPVFLSFSGGG